MAAGARVSVHVRMVLPSLQGEGQGWGLYLSVREPVNGVIFSAGKELLTPPLPLPYKGGEWLPHEVGGERLSHEVGGERLRMRLAGSGCRMRLAGSGCGMRLTGCCCA